MIPRVRPSRAHEKCHPSGWHFRWRPPSRM